MMKKLLIASLVAVLAACQTTNPDVIQRGDAQRLSQVQDATLLSVRPVTVDGSQSGAGAVTGGVVGAVAGGSVGGRREGLVVGVLGAVAGAALGNAVERSATKEDAVELLLQMRNGERRAIVQAKGAEVWQPGEPVILVTTGGRTRVMRAPATTGAPQSNYQQPQYQQPQYRQQ
ncbi:outer membrane lipoprotein [Roseateles depolymerans]|uniref:17 kDa surface antigen n=1 Tax=Roseateles depolymerans TaxID=76731 RepID=A0A0U3N0A8_9BURK|nr:glycine zipper 2TM domain-containing protein [Roseateles depolymerans]ALV05659.1 17 kDa surface antigen [Roseateles depolymerans]REG14321.1 outer membrane lipoprotein SlyB [Roseateles depolymerans]